MSSNCDRGAVLGKREGAIEIVRLLELLDDVPKGAGVIADSDITSHDGDDLGRFAEQFSCSQMHRVEGADRFDGERAPNASEHGSVHIEDEATPLEGS